ncbi:caspase-1-like [Uranotaenia lowii]|uniref:caspase-1-like n=1 Tax=Uranotaenia lowii TaxID=190385 RepID=UPI002478608D|nr:caspase-1-like [Uranotaenia lowii]
MEERCDHSLGTPPSTSTDDKRKASVFLKVPIAQESRFYAMNGKKRGKVLIFNHRLFDDETYEERIGTKEDVIRLRKTLPKLGFLSEDITMYRNFSRKEIELQAMNLYADSTLVDCDCLITFILTHGETGDRLMARDTSYPLYRIIEHYTPSALPSMAGKPKLFIVQACRGGYLDSGRIFLENRSLMDSMDSVGNTFTYPEYADFLIVMSSHLGHVSFINKEGSWLIQEFCNVVDNCRVDQDSIYDILTKTNAAVSKRVSCNADGKLDGKKQVSSFYSTLTKSLYFARK